MRVGIQAWGSEGDIRPLIALGYGLVRRGHGVELIYTDITNRHYESVARSLGFMARPVAMPVVADRDEMYRVGLEIVNARNPLTQGKIIFDRFLTAVSVTFVHTMVPSRHLHPQGLPRLGEVGNVVGWRVARFALNTLMRPAINRFRRRLGLRPVGDVLLDAWASHLLTSSRSVPPCARRPRTGRTGTGSAAFSPCHRRTTSPSRRTSRRSSMRDRPRRSWDLAASCRKSRRTSPRRRSRHESRKPCGPRACACARKRSRRACGMTMGGEGRGIDRAGGTVRLRGQGPLRRDHSVAPG